MLRLSRWEWLLLLQAAVSVTSIRVALWLLPYAKVRAHLARRQSVSKHPQPAARVVRFVSAASRFVPQATCLTRAVAAELLLRRNGHDASLEIGVSKNASNHLVAHAWVECGGVILMGGDEVEGLVHLRAAVTPPPS